MLEKYLNDDPLPWLLAQDNPDVATVTRRDILGEIVDDRSYAALLNSSPIRRMFHALSKGILGDYEHFDILYRGSLWYLCEAVTRGLDRRSAEIARTVDAVCDRAQTADGGFSYNWEPMIPVGCVTGEMVCTLIDAGYRDERVIRGLQWIAAHQRHDGGWRHCPLGGWCDQLKLIFLKKPGNGLSREYDEREPSCVFATAACARALIAGHALAEVPAASALSRASAWLLAHDVFRGPLQRDIGCQRGDGSAGRMLGIPVFAQYDIVMGLGIIDRSGAGDEPRFADHFNRLMSWQNNDGTWNLGRTGSGMLLEKSMSHVGVPNKWVTVRVLRFLKWLSSAEGCRSKSHFSVDDPAG